MLKDDAKSVKDVLPLADDGKSAWVSSIYEAKDKIFVYAPDTNLPSNALGGMKPGHVYEVRKELIDSITHHTLAEGLTPCAG
jgi:hypothetical protein